VTAAHGLLGLSAQPSGVAVLTFDGLPIATVTATATHGGHRVTIGAVAVVTDPVTYEFSGYEQGVRVTDVGEHPLVRFEDGEPALPYVAEAVAAEIGMAAIPDSDPAARHAAVAALLDGDPAVSRVALYTDGLVCVLLRWGYRSDAEPATDISERLREHGHQARVVTVSTGAGHIYEVRVDPAH
jgi:hypothetical protein